MSDTPDASRRKRPLSAGLGCLRAAGATLLLAWVVLELPALLGWIDYRAWLFPDLTTGGGPDRVVFDPELIFRRRADLSYRETYQGDFPLAGELVGPDQFLVEYQYDHQGFRNAPARSAAAVALVGDSLIEGFMMPTEQLVSAQLEAILQHDRPVAALPVINLGHSDYGPPQELIVTTRYALPALTAFQTARPTGGPEAWTPAVVWFFFGGNDLTDVADYVISTRGWRQAFLATGTAPARSFSLSAMMRIEVGLESLCGATRRGPAPLIDRLPAALAGGQTRPITFSGAGDEFAPADPERLEKAEACVAQAVRACRDGGFRFLLVYVPTKYAVYGDLCLDRISAPPDRRPLAENLARWARQQGVDFVDLTPRLRAAASQGIVVHFLTDGHWSAAGHGLVAQVVAERLLAGGHHPNSRGMETETLPNPSASGPAATRPAARPASARTRR